MISSNADKVAKSMMKARELVARKMKNMVRGFAYQMSLSLSIHTPIGNPEQYINLYKRRFEIYGIDPDTPGFHRGSWRYSETPRQSLDRRTLSSDEMLDQVKMEARADYKLGDTFYITNNSPAILNLEANLSKQTQGQGIKAPALEFLMQAYTFNMKRYYDEGK